MNYKKMTKKSLVEMMKIKDETIDCQSRLIESLGRENIKARGELERIGTKYAKVLILQAKSKIIQQNTLSLLENYNPIAEAERIVRNENYKN